VGAYVSIASKELVCSKTVQKAVHFISVANRGLRPKSRLQKTKTPARWLALSGSGAILPKKYCTPGLSFCQQKTGKIAGEAAGKRQGPQAFKPKAEVPGHCNAA
jgi:hypothetical protein